MKRLLATGILLICVSYTVDGTTVRLPPTITVQPQKSVIFRSEDSVTLECLAEGTPNITYTWKKNGFDLDLNLSKIKRDNDSTITISPATSMDEGYYQCFAKNQFGTALSITSHIQRAFLDSISGTPSVVEKTVTEGEPFQIQAVTRKSFPKPTYGWEIAKDTVDRDPLGLNPSSRCQIDDNGNLYVAYAKPEDEFSGRIYKSTIYNQYLDLKAGGGYTKVIVTRAALNLSQPTLGFASVSPTIGLVGSSVSLRCFFYGNPEPTIEWTFRGNSLPRDEKFKKEKFDTELHIKNVAPSDEGNYTCTGSNSKGRIPHVIRLSVEKEPSFATVADGPHDVDATEGDSITFRCNADAKPEADIVWLQNGIEIKVKEAPRRFVFSGDRKSLTIQNICLKCEDRDTDITVIQCNASNRHGYAFASGYLNVFERTVVTGEPVVTVDIHKIKDLDLACSVKHDNTTPVNWTWYKKERYGNNKKDEKFERNLTSTFLDGSRLKFRLQSKKSSLAKDWKSLLGTYICIADNGISSSNQTIVLQEYKANITEPNCFYFDLPFDWLCYVIMAGIALVIVAFFVICICCLCYHNRHRDEYDVDAKERWTGTNPEKELMAFDFLESYRVETIDRTMKSSKASLSCATLLRIDEEASLNDYGDDMGKFTEDGSFLGTYRSQQRAYT